MVRIPDDSDDDQPPDPASPTAESDSDERPLAERRSRQNRSQGGVSEGLALRRAVLEGGRFAAYKKAFAEREHKTVRRRLHVVRQQPAEGPRWQRWLQPDDRPGEDGRP